MEKPQIEVNSDIPAIGLQALAALKESNSPKQLFNRPGLPMRILDDGTLQVIMADILNSKVSECPKLVSGR